MEKTNYVLCDEKVFFWPWHSVANLKVELLNGEQKNLRSMRWKSFFANLKVELLNGELDGEDEGGGEGDGHPPVADLDGEVGELGLQDGPLLLLPILLAALRLLA
jgi:hypothetical protein